MPGRFPCVPIRRAPRQRNGPQAGVLRNILDVFVRHARLRRHLSGGPVTSRAFFTSLDPGRKPNGGHSIPLREHHLAKDRCQAGPGSYCQHVISHFEPMSLFSMNIVKCKPSPCAHSHVKSFNTGPLRDFRFKTKHDLNDADCLHIRLEERVGKPGTTSIHQKSRAKNHGDAPKLLAEIWTGEKIAKNHSGSPQS